MKTKDRRQKTKGERQKTEVGSRKSEVGSQWLETRRLQILCCLLSSVFCLLSCGSVPNLESPECEEARNTVREFYSVHFGGEMKPSEEYLARREKFLTAGLRDVVSKNLADTRDYFTGTDDYPRAFRVGGCEVAAPDKTVFSILVFWKTDTRTEQREIKVEAVRENDRWLINKTF